MNLSLRFKSNDTTPFQYQSDDISYQTCDILLIEVSVKMEPYRGTLESTREEPLHLYTCFFPPWLSGWRFAFKLRCILAAGGCGRMMPEVPPRRTVPSLLLNLTLGFTKRALCLR